MHVLFQQNELDVIRLRLACPHGPRRSEVARALRTVLVYCEHEESWRECGVGVQKILVARSNRWLFHKSKIATRTGCRDRCEAGLIEAGLINVLAGLRRMVWRCSDTNATNTMTQQLL